MNARRILVIDDDEGLREEVARVLELNGFDVETARNGRVALERIGAWRPDLVVCDLVMPELGGYETLQAVRDLPDTATLPFLMLTGRDDRQHVRHGMELGADDYLTKPFKIGELLRAVEAALAKRARVEREVESSLEHLREHVALALPHELRTPLACILGYAEMLADGNAGAPGREVIELAQQIISAGNRLNRLSENTLLYVQLELLGQGRGTLETAGPSATRMDEVVWRQARLTAKAYGREADLVLDLAAAPVVPGGTYVGKVVDELVDNAFKFSPARSPVRVATAVEGSHGVLRVSDAGSGMTEEQIGIVGAFVQFERSLREQQGMGLGLSIAKRIASVCGGELSIASVPSAGTTVEVRLPSHPGERAASAGIGRS